MRINRNMIASMATPNPPSPARPASPPVATLSVNDRPAQFDSQALLGDRAEVQIVHGDQVYRLRRTALGKLILTK